MCTEIYFPDGADVDTPEELRERWPLGWPDGPPRCLCWADIPALAAANGARVVKLDTGDYQVVPLTPKVARFGYFKVLSVTPVPKEEPKP